MSIRRIFDFAHHAHAKFPKEDMFVTKYNGEWKVVNIKSGG